LRAGIDSIENGHKDTYNNICQPAEDFGHFIFIRIPPVDDIQKSHKNNQQPAE